MKDIISELKKQNLLGRSGSGFPTGLKWEMVRKFKADKKYIVCNGSEGEPGTRKDEYILRNHPEKVISGIKIALKTIDRSSAFFYLRKEYYRRFKGNLKKLAKGSKIEFSKKKGGYLAGEETVVCEVIEGRKPEPRIKPPFPAESGLWGYPTLINNVETFYCVAKIFEGTYEKKRFFTIGGDVKNPGVYELPLNWSIEKILKETGNYPVFDFFVQSGGGAMGEILLPKELNKRVLGIGTILIFNKKTDPFSLMKKWTTFFLNENCDKCTPCREGVYRIDELVSKKKLDKKLLDEIYFVLENTSLCPLGKNLSVPFKSLIKKVVK